MERSGLFNSENGDRKYNAKVFAKMISLMISNGVYFSPANNLQVVEIKDSMKVKINDGVAFINGYIYENKNELNDELTFTLPSSPNGDLIYRIMLRLDADENRLIRAYAINGEISKTPVAPPLIRNDKYYDICLAEILVKQGQTFIKPSDIKDTRLSNELCGITRIPLEHLKTEEVFRQFNEWFAEQKVILGTDLTTWEAEYKKKYEEFKKAQEQAFNEWFAGIKAMLGDNPNTALINEMDKLRKDMSSMMEIYKTEIYASMEKLKEDIKNDPSILGCIKTVNNKIADSKGNVDLKAVDIKTTDGQTLEQFKIDTNLELNKKAVKDGTLQTNLNSEKLNGKTATKTPLTTEKTDVIGMVNELFTDANNGKTAVANAITAKGVSSSPTDTFSVLATKIGQISTGKKYARGTIYAYNDEISVTNLNFKPSIIIASLIDVSSDSYNNFVFFTSLNFLKKSNETNLQIARGTVNGGTGQFEYSSASSNDSLFNGGFLLHGICSNKTYDWIAIE